MTWVWFALLSATGSAGTSLLLKRTVARGDVFVSTAGFRMISGVFIAAIVGALGAWSAPTPAYWRTLAVLMVPEIGGMVSMALALREGDISRVQPIMGMLPIFVTINGALFMHEVPTALAAAGIVLVAIGIYTVGLQRGASPVEPLRALGRDRGSWYAVMSAVFWSVTPFLHKVGTATVGPLMWAMSVSLASGLVLAVVLPLQRRIAGGTPGARPGWTMLVVATAAPFTLQAVALQFALQRAQGGYVMAISSMSTLIATGLAVLLYHEGGGSTRIPGAVLVTAGAALIALGA
ncbi:MAG: EamA family transporter [Gemmatimonadaceae bacterium]